MTQDRLKPWIIEKLDWGVRHRLPNRLRTLTVEDKRQHGGKIQLFLGPHPKGFFETVRGAKAIARKYERGEL